MKATQNTIAVSLLSPGIMVSDYGIDYNSNFYANNEPFTKPNVSSTTWLSLIQTILKHTCMDLNAATGEI